MLIGELSRTAQTPVRTIRYYEGIGLLPPAERSGSGYRIFTDQHLQRLRFVRAARSLGLKLSQVREILDVASVQATPCDCVRDVVQQNITVIEQKMAALQSMRDALERTLTRIEDAEPSSRGVKTPICPAIESMPLPNDPVTLDSPVDWRA